MYEIKGSGLNKVRCKIEYEGWSKFKEAILEVGREVCGKRRKESEGWTKEIRY